MSELMVRTLAAMAMIALALVRYDFFGRRASNYLIVIPTATPEVVLGASLLSMFLIYGLQLGFSTLLIAHVMFCISFVVIVFIYIRIAGSEALMGEEIGGADVVE